ncbi:MAG: GNAT family N-acetyltransferase [Pseudomonadota bacterium]
MDIDALTAEFHTSIDAIDALAWDRLVGPRLPHLSHAFLRAAEQSGSVSEDTGWLPCHLTLTSGDDLVAAMPLYQKSHSWGEFIFDWSWADAYHRSGLAYYPKLISASPFTPATGSKLLVVDDERSDILRNTLIETAIRFASSHGFSSLHWHFLDPADLAVFEGHDETLIRTDCQFHWRNNDYRDFDDMIGAFSSKKRKNVRRERRRILEQGITHHIVAGKDITEDELDAAFRLCRNTFLVRGHEPYLNLDFLKMLLTSQPKALALVLAEKDERPVAAAILLRGEDTLYGRYWGSEGDFHSLHFETCYYQGIEYCIREGITTFEPGTQGEHKVSRGFLPTKTHSAHWLAHPQFADAIADYLQREQRGVETYMQDIDDHSPFRRSDEPPA